MAEENLVSVVLGDIEIMRLETAPAEIRFEHNGDIEIQYFGSERPEIALIGIGPAGPTGIKGDNGPKGDNGDKGDKGDKGDTGDITPALVSLRDQAQAAATAANTSKTDAAGSATNSAASATAAQTARAGAETARTDAQTARTQAQTARSGAETARDTANTHATSASTSAANAATSVANALASEQDAADSATAAANSAQAANVAEQGAEGILEHLRGSFLGLQASDPAVDLNGDALTGGEIYVNSASGRLRFYSGSEWSSIGVTEPEMAAQIQAAVDALINGAGATLDTLAEIAQALGNDPNFATTMTSAIAGKLTKSQNLADVADAAAARANIGANNAGNLTTGTLPGARFNDTSHGNRGGGALHAAATQTVAGFMSAADKSKLDGLGLGDQTQVELANAPLKDTPVDGDSVALLDSASGNAIKRTTWLRIKAVLKSYFDTVYSAVGHVHTKAQITDFAHTHAIGDLPVAASGASSTTQLVRADDTRLSNARTPLAHAHDQVTIAVDGFMSAADKVKLNGIAASATANATDAQLRARSSHTGTQAIATVDGLQVALDGKLGSSDQAVDSAKLAGALPATAATASTIAQRDANGDITARYILGQYVSMSHAAAARTTDTIFFSSTDNNIRKNTLAGFKTSLALTISDVSGLQATLDVKAPLASPALSGTPTAPTPAAGDNSTKIATTAFVAAGLATKQSSLGFTPVQQGGGTGQGTNKLLIGWGTSSRLLLQVDATNFQDTWPININGNASTASNAAKLGGLDAATAATGNTIVQRTADGDISARYVAGAYTSMSHAATVRNADTVFYSSTDDYIRKNTAAGFKASLAFTIADIASLQATLNAKANLASPALTGTPTAPTAAVGTNSTQIANTAFVKAAVDALGSAGAWEVISSGEIGGVTASVFTDLGVYTALRITASLHAVSGSSVANLRWSNNNGASWIAGGYYWNYVSAASDRSTLLNTYVGNGASVALALGGNPVRADHNAVVATMTITSFNKERASQFVGESSGFTTSSGSPLLKASIGGSLTEGSTGPANKGNALVILYSTPMNGHIVLEGIRG